MCTRTVFVGDLSYFCRESHIMQLFSSVGHVIDIDLKRNSEGESQLHAFVKFESEMSVPVAIEVYNGVKYMGRRMVVNGTGTRAVKKDYNNWYKLTVHFTTVDNVEVTEEFIDALCSPYGVIGDCIVRAHQRIQTPQFVLTGYAVVFYHEQAGANRALSALNGQVVQGLRLSCTLSPRPNDVLLMQQQHQQQNIFSRMHIESNGFPGAVHTAPSPRHLNMPSSDPSQFRNNNNNNNGMTQPSPRHLPYPAHNNMRSHNSFTQGSQDLPSSASMGNYLAQQQFLARQSHQQSQDMPQGQPPKMKMLMSHYMAPINTSGTYYGGAGGMGSLPTSKTAPSPRETSLYQQSLSQYPSYGQQPRGLSKPMSDEPSMLGFKSNAAGNDVHNMGNEANFGGDWANSSGYRSMSDLLAALPGRNTNSSSFSVNASGNTSVASYGTGYSQSSSLFPTMYPGQSVHKSSSTTSSLSSSNPSSFILPHTSSTGSTAFTPRLHNSSFSALIANNNNSNHVGPFDTGLAPGLIPTRPEDAGVEVTIPDSNPSSFFVPHGHENDQNTIDLIQSLLASNSFSEEANQKAKLSTPHLQSDLLVHPISDNDLN